MNLEGLLQNFIDEMRDEWRLAAQRYMDIMTSNQDVMNAIAALPVPAQTAALTQLGADVTAAISDMGAANETAREAMVSALLAAKTQMDANTAQSLQIDAQLVAAIAAATSPPATPPASS